MKDKELEKAFNGYFEGVNTPDNITQDAKKQVKKRSAFLPALAKYGSIAASAVLVVAVSVVLLSRSNLFKVKSDNAPELLTYSSEQITTIEGDAYTLSKTNGALKFIENIACSKNAAVNNVEIASFENEETAHVRAEISMVTDTRYDAEVYVEFAEYSFAPLAEYQQGSSGYYHGISYKLIRTTDDSGELVCKLYAKKGEVKYYFNVKSSDSESYLKCLQLIL